MQFVPCFRRYGFHSVLWIGVLAGLLLPTGFHVPARSGQTQAASLQDVHSHTKTESTVKGVTVKLMSAHVMAARPLAMFYSMDDSPALQSLSAHASEMTVLAPQCFWIGKDGSVYGALPSQIAEIARRARLPIMPLVYNRGFLQPAVTAVLRNSSAQQRLIENLVLLARRDHLLGFQIDFENIDARDENLYSRFTQRAASALHQDGRLLSVAVVPRFEDTSPGEWSAAYDYYALAEHADFLAVMAYDHSSRTGPPGPIAGYGWVKKAIEYAVARVPGDKLLLGIPLYGREWIEGGRDNQTETVDYLKAATLLAEFSLVPRWDERWRSPWFEYKASGKAHSVWYEDARSVHEKLQLVQEYRLRGFAAWRLGMEDPRIWPVISAMQEARPAAGDRVLEPAF